MEISEKTKARIEATADIATLGMAVVLSVVLIRAYFLPARAAQSPAAAAEVVVGMNLKGRVPGVDWSKNGRTLVLALSTQCHYCKESSPFYRRVHEQTGKG